MDVDAAASLGLFEGAGNTAVVEGRIVSSCSECPDGRSLGSVFATLSGELCCILVGGGKILAESVGGEPAVEEDLGSKVVAEAGWLPSW